MGQCSWGVLMHADCENGRSEVVLHALWAYSLVRIPRSVPHCDRNGHMHTHTDGGMAMSSADRAVVDGMLVTLAGTGQGQRPLKDPRLFGNWNVVYTSSGANQSSSRECKPWELR